MNKKGSTPTRESLVLKAAMDAAPVNMTEVALELGVDRSLISQWCNSIRPVSAAKARELAEILGIDDPAKISRPWADAQKHLGVTQAAPKPMEDDRDERRPDLVIARLENDVHALSLALGLLVSVMVVHRPAEAADVAEAIKKRVPRKWRDKGLIAELQKSLELAGKR
jgi:transcriptional regulator with XRE-family HTH domain